MSAGDYPAYGFIPDDGDDTRGWSERMLALCKEERKKPGNSEKECGEFSYPEQNPENHDLKSNGAAARTAARSESSRWPRRYIYDVHSSRRVAFFPVIYYRFAPHFPCKNI